MTITATYSPEDNKIRLYPSERLDAETYARVKAAGFSWAPRQELFVAPKWTPGREDLAIELAGDIEPEEMTLAERATLKAARLETLAQKRHNDAIRLSSQADLSEAATGIPFGQPILVGHHSERKHRRVIERANRAAEKAAKAEKLANYWLYRAEGVERFANMKNNDRTRANRIKTLLAELRDLQRAINAAHNALEIWAKLRTDDQIRYALGNIDSNVTLAPYGLYSDEKDGKISPQDARAKCIALAELRINGPTRRRWIDHTLNRLAFERSMLGEIPRFMGEMTPVIIQAFAREHGAEKPKCMATDPGYFQLESPVPLPLHIADKTYLELSADEWRDLMQEVGYQVPEKTARRVNPNKVESVPLINPTAEHAAQLQRIWHAQATAKYGGKGYKFEAREVRELTQAVYSANAKGTYSPLSTIEIDAEGREVRTVWREMKQVRTGEPVARVRVFTGGMQMYGPKTVLRISDKPAKPLPIDLDAIEAALSVSGLEAAA